jgi:hypothetical protein
MEGEALIAWIATAGVGLSLAGIWLERGGWRFRGARRISPRLLLTHVTPAVLGLVTWILYLFTDAQAFAWIAFVLLLFVASIGAAQFVIWQRRRHGVLRATPQNWDLRAGSGAAHAIPPEQHFPVGAVVLHGLLAVVTVLFVFLTALAAANEKEAPTTGTASAITPTTARLTGEPGDAEGEARFQLGQTRSYDLAGPARRTREGGYVATAARLAPATEYHYRLVVGHDAGPDRTFVTRPPERVDLSRVSIAPRRFAKGGDARLSFTLNAPATVRAGVYRARIGRRVSGSCGPGRPSHRRPSCRLYERVETLVLDGRAGANAVALGKKPEVSKLSPGRYKLVLVGAVAGGRPSAPESERMRILEG